VIHEVEQARALASVLSHSIGAVRLRLLALLLILTVASIPLRANSKIVERWVLTGAPMPQLKKILILAVLENYLIRQRFEDEMERLLHESGVQGIKSHMVLPPRNEMMEGELKQRITESTLDGVLIIRPIDVRKESEEVTLGVYVPPPGFILSGRTGTQSPARSIQPLPTLRKTPSFVRNLISTAPRTKSFSGAAKATRSIPKILTN
jgi:hypothetical protein